jgi:large subunit ribosomal protein L23
MALFSSSKKAAPKTKRVSAKAKADAPVVKAKAPKSATPAAASLGMYGSVIIKPRITEKTANLSAGNVFTFEIASGATKHDVMRAIAALYKVQPTKVNIVTTAGKKVSLRTRRGFGTTASVRKAYVFLKQGDTIDFAA